MATAEQEYYLRQFAALQFPGSPDNVETRAPYHMVQTRDDRLESISQSDAEDGTFGDDVVLGDSCGNVFQRCVDYVSANYDNDGDEALEIVDYPVQGGVIRILNNPDDAIYVADLDDYWDAYGIDANTISYYRREKDYRDVSIHFTLKEAKRYMQYQGHNLKQPRTYTYGPGYGDRGDWETLRTFLYEEGKKLLAEELPTLDGIATSDISPIADNEDELKGVPAGIVIARISGELPLAILNPMSVCGPETGNFTIECVKAEFGFDFVYSVNEKQRWKHHAWLGYNELGKLRDNIQVLEILNFMRYRA